MTRREIVITLLVETDREPDHLVEGVKAYMEHGTFRESFADALSERGPAEVRHWEVVSSEECPDECQSCGLHRVL